MPKNCSLKFFINNFDISYHNIFNQVRYCGHIRCFKNLLSNIFQIIKFNIMNKMTIDQIIIKDKNQEKRENNPIMEYANLFMNLYLRFKEDYQK